MQHSMTAKLLWLKSAHNFSETQTIMGCNNSKQAGSGKLDGEGRFKQGHSDSNVPSIVSTELCV